MRLPLLALLLAAILVPVSSPALAADDDVRAYLLDESDDFIEEMRAAEAEINGQNIYDCIDDITSDLAYSYRLMNSPTHDLFVDKHANEFTTVSSKIKTHVMHFESGGVQGGNPVLSGGDNIIGVLPGKDLTKWIVMGGHYDTQTGTIGAIDNGSGLCTVRELARAYTALDHQYEATLVFAWWDGEEWGLYGSRAFVEDHNSTKESLGLPKDADVTIMLGQSYDIVGINYPALNTWVQYGDQNPTTMDETAILNLRVAPAHEENLTLCPAYACYKRLAEREDWQHVLEGFQNHSSLVQEINYGMLGLPPKFVQALDDEYGRSDQMPFIAAGVPGMRIQGSHDDEFASYHRPSDTVAAAELQAGGRENLVAGLNQAADSGGLVVFYAAMKGNLGSYWNRTAESFANAPGRTGTANKQGSDKDVGTPGFEAILAVAAIALIATSLRRRQ